MSDTTSPQADKSLTPCPAVLASEGRPRFVETPSGRIAYTERGSGPVALFVHGVLMNKHLWRHQVSALSDVRRCVAVDLLAHGDTEISVGQDVSVTANAHMLGEVIDALHIDQVDIIGNDSGGGISQIFAALNPERIRSLVLTNCDTHDNWPPEAFLPVMNMAAAGGLPGTLNAMLSDKSVYRAPEGLGLAYEDPNSVSNADIDAYLTPFVRSDQHTRNLQRFLGAFDNQHTLAIEDQLRNLAAPALIVWGTDDIYFSVKWAHWLGDNLAGAKPPIELDGARLFFPEERPDAFNEILREHFSTL
jgi:pimeloyl-ACP methyl ester carboxylesterase